MKKLIDMSPFELGESEKEDAIKYLIMYLTKGKPNEKRLAASAIGKLSDKYKESCQKAIPFLIENLQDGHGQVRQYTLKALMKLNVSSKYYSLIKDLSEKETAAYNKRAAEQLLEFMALSRQPETGGDITAETRRFVSTNGDEFVSNKEEDFITLLNNKCGIKLTDKQKSAVLHKDGPALVLAVPGAGKTTVLLARTANLIINHGINPASILSITFSKASAIDMKNRYYSFFSDITSIGANFSTIHSFCYELLRKYSVRRGINYKIIEGGESGIDKRNILRKVYREINGEVIDDDALEDLISSIGYVKNMVLSEDEMKNYALNVDVREFISIYSAYEQIKKKNNFIDYDDMLTIAYNILIMEKDILIRYRELYKYIQIDEGQDTSKIQHKIIELLTKPQDNIFIVADDDQSIYSFRGAYPKFLLEFDKIYDSTKKYFIEQNFRSTPEVVGIANNFIKNNSERFNKELHTANPSGEEVKIVKVTDEVKQADYIINEIARCNYKNNVILYRNNMASIRLADELSRRNLAFYLKDYNRFFFKHFIVEDIKAFIMFTLNYSDLEAVNRIYFKINSFISKDTMEKINRNYDGGKDIFTLGDSMVELATNQSGALKRLKKVFDRMKYLSPVELIDYIEKDLGYNKYLKENAVNFGYSYDSLRVILTNLKALSSRCTSFINFLKRLEDLEIIMENSRQKRDASLILSTIHSSKGLEFDNVFIIDLIDNIMPTRGSIEAYEKGETNELEEERRLMYVALTRAKKNLHIIITENKNDEAVKPSRFIKEIIMAGMQNTTK